MRVGFGARQGQARAALIVAALLAGGCASDPNRAAAQRSANACTAAIYRADPQAAEEACTNTLALVRDAKLGARDEATALYDLALVKRRIGKLDEAEEGFKEALALEEKISGPISARTGRRLAELAATLAQADRWSEGFQYVDRLPEIGDLYTGSERKFVAGLLYAYADKAEEMSRQNAGALRAGADKLGFKAEEVRWHP